MPKPRILRDMVEFFLFAAESERAKMSYFYYHVKAEQPLKKRIATLREWGYGAAGSSDDPFAV